MKKAKFVLLTSLFVFTFFFAFTQTEIDSTTILIETKDGNRFTGKVVSEDSENLVLSTESFGEISIQKKNIATRKVIPGSQVKDGKWWFYTPQSSRYFWAPNGYGLKNGEGYYHNIWVLWNQFAYGLTDHLSIGGAVIPLFLFGGVSTPVFISPKISVPIVSEKFNIGAGALLGTILGENDSGFGIVYGVSTWGSRDHNISFGLGYGYLDGEWASSPLINISGMTRLSPRWYLLSENNVVITNEEMGGLVSAGARWMIRKAALDFGIVVLVGSDVDNFYAIPWLGFTVPFGNVN